MEQIKKCSVCFEEKEISNFDKYSKNFSYGDGHKGFCKDCRRKRARKSYNKNKEYRRACARKGGKSWTPEKPRKRGPNRMCTQCMKSARNIGVPFSLTPEDIVIPEKCPVLDIPLEFSKDRKRKDNTPSVDRLIPELGYVSENIRVISWKANQLKNDMSLEQCKKMYEFFSQAEREQKK